MKVLRFSMQGEDILNVLMASVLCLYFSMQEDDILEHSVMASVICLHFSQLSDHCVT